MWSGAESMSGTEPHNEVCEINTPGVEQYSKMFEFDSNKLHTWLYNSCDSFSGYPGGCLHDPPFLGEEGAFRKPRGYPIALERL